MHDAMYIIDKLAGVLKDLDNASKLLIDANCEANQNGRMTTAWEVWEAKKAIDDIDKDAILAVIDRLTTELENEDEW